MKKNHFQTLWLKRISNPEEEPCTVILPLAISKQDIGMLSILFYSVKKCSSTREAKGKGKTGDPPAGLYKDKLSDQRCKHVLSRMTVEFGNSPLVRQHLRLLSARGDPSIFPVRLQVNKSLTLDIW